MDMVRGKTVVKEGCSSALAGVLTERNMERTFENVVVVFTMAVNLRKYQPRRGGIFIVQVAK
jgi:hypothetical protein